MARGPKPKPPELHVIQGTFRDERHSTALATARDLTKASSQPVPPYKLDKEQQAVWDEYINRLFWNTEAESDLFSLWVDLTVDKRKQERGLQTKYEWNAAMLGRYSTISAELGVGYANKTKIPTKKTDKEKKESKHFK